ncbi:hypothetical protein PGTUg99_023369 [Puccinia graminis f. sp. tritici]|nr:hypothetical protein PGTUg99_023369 [Puccinia graminis f. sp. tritici]
MQPAPDAMIAVYTRTSPGRLGDLPCGRRQPPGSNSRGFVGLVLYSTSFVPLEHQQSSRTYPTSSAKGPNSED